MLSCSGPKLGASVCYNRTTSKLYLTSSKVLVPFVQEHAPSDLLWAQLDKGRQPKKKPYKSKVNLPEDNYSHSLCQKGSQIELITT